MENKVQNKQRYFEPRQLMIALSQNGIHFTLKMINDYINKGYIKAERDMMRPTRWLIPRSELERILSNGNSN